MKKNFALFDMLSHLSLLRQIELQSEENREKNEENYLMNINEDLVHC